MTILYLTFYFEPDLCPGSFRSTALVTELARQLSPADHIHVVTTQPNRYRSFRLTAPEHEQRGGPDDCPVVIDRVPVPPHASGFIDQIRSFIAYYWAAYRLTKGHEYDLVVASSSRLFTAFLGARLTRKRSVSLFLDIRDLFRETILEMLKRSALTLVLKPVLWTVERYTFGYATHINLVSEGFRSYFNSFPQATYSYFTNGIDDEFLGFTSPDRRTGEATVRTILYAGNIGEGQGLHKIIPQAARQLGEGYHFVVIGDGGARTKLEKTIQEAGITNVELRDPVSRNELIWAYQQADYLFVHLNDLKALNRVLPSKLFEYGATDKPIIAGVAGYAAGFVRQHLVNSILFDPGDVDEFVTQLRQTPYRTQKRTEFVAQFGRRTIMQQLARQIVLTIPATVPTTDTLNPPKPVPA